MAGMPFKDAVYRQDPKLTELVVLQLVVQLILQPRRAQGPDDLEHLGRRPRDVEVQGYVPAVRLGCAHGGGVGGELPPVLLGPRDQRRSRRLARLLLQDVLRRNHSNFDRIAWEARLRGTMLLRPPARDCHAQGVGDRVLQRATLVVQWRVRVHPVTVLREGLRVLCLEKHRSQNRADAVAALGGDGDAGRSLVSEAGSCLFAIRFADDLRLLGTIRSEGLAFLLLRRVCVATGLPTMLRLDEGPRPRPHARAADHRALRPLMPILPDAIDGALDVPVAIPRLDGPAGLARGAAMGSLQQYGPRAVLRTRAARLRARTPWLPIAPHAVDGASVGVAHLADGARPGAQGPIAGLRSVDDARPVPLAAAASDVALAAGPRAPDAIEVASLHIALLVLRGLAGALVAAMLRGLPGALSLGPTPSTDLAAIAPTTPIVPPAIHRAWPERARPNVCAVSHVASRVEAAGSVRLERSVPVLRLRIARATAPLRPMVPLARILALEEVARLLLHATRVALLAPAM
mmetsp:Transcript_129273/g.374303  ORF Transcript_129273/g.374303 Transcript_129273/m.374303 type:complete len:518 (-) Transcript_129273:343-1896(-)